MSEKTAQYVDGFLVDWGAIFFNQSEQVKPVKSGTSLSGLKPKKNTPSAKGGHLQKGKAISAKTVRARLSAMAKKAPEVMVKVSGGGKGMKAIRPHLEYISRNGKIELENQSGEVIEGREGLNDLFYEWKNGAVRIEEDSDLKQAFNVVFSMPEGTDPIAVKRAVRDFAAKEFADHQYVMALHTFDTDPDKNPSRHPHVHLAVKAYSEDGVRLNPRKADLQHWREGFAEALREHGVEAAASKRQQRLKQERGEKQSVRYKKARGEKLDRVGRNQGNPEAKRKALETEKKVLGSYRELTKKLADSDSAEDRKLAVDLLNTVGSNLRKQQKETNKDRER